MTVQEVWGRIQGQDSALISQEGDVWTFAVPSWVTNPVIAEFWARDEAGNIAYRSAILTVENGTIKCIRWMHSDGICLMRSVERSALPVDVRSRIAMETAGRSAAMVEARSVITMEKHVCSRMEA